MRTDHTPRYRRTTELESDAMISEGGAIRQPSMKDSEAAYARLDKPCARVSLWHEWQHNPMAMFLTGIALGFALASLKRHPDRAINDV